MASKEFRKQEWRIAHPASVSAILRVSDHLSRVQAIRRPAGDFRSTLDEAEFTSGIQLYRG